jgi:hypothetical protein
MTLLIINEGSTKMTKLKCTDSSGLEGQLIEGESYEVAAFSPNLVLIKERKGVCRWYGESRFEREPVVMEPLTGIGDRYDRQA